LELKEKGREGLKKPSAPPDREPAGFFFTGKKPSAALHRGSPEGLKHRKKLPPFGGPEGLNTQEETLSPFNHRGRRV
jgi:hypothetical protein